jgi:hypothetical protein
MVTAMASSDGDDNGRRQGCQQQQWLTATQQRWRLQWLTETTTAMADGNGNGDRQLQQRRQQQRQWQWSWQQQRRWQWQWQWRRPRQGRPLQGRVASSCGGDVQCFWRGDTLPPPPWTQKKVHSPALRHGGNTAKSVCSPSRGRVPDSSPWIVFCLFLQLLFSLLNNPLFAPRIIQALKNPVSQLMLYLLHSSKNSVSLLTIYPHSYYTFCQCKTRQGCNDYNLSFLC